MKNLILLIFILSFLKGFSQIEEEYYPNGNLKSKIDYNSKGETVGVYEIYYENGFIREKGQYNNRGNEIGRWRTNLKDSSYYVIDYDKKGVIQLRHGYTKDGRVLEEKPYQNGLVHGTWTIYLGNGNVFQTENYSNGKLHGIRKVFDSKNGEILLESENYENGEKTGECLYFHDNGKKKEAFNYIDGDTYKLAYFYYEDGTLKEIVSTKNDFPDGLSKAYHPNGNLATTIFAKGFSMTIKTYSEDGELIETTKI